MIRQQLGRLARNSLTYGIGQVANRFISFLLLPVFTSYLTPSDYGVISILGLMVFVLTPVFSLGFGTATGVCYFEGNNQTRKESTIWTAFIILLISVSILAVLGMTFVQQISWVLFQTSDHGYLVTISIISTCLSNLSIPFILYLQFEEKAKTFVTLTIITTLISIGLSVLMVVVLRKGVQGFVEGRLMGQAVSMIAYMIVVAPSLRFRFSWGIGRELLRLGIPMIPSFASLFILQQINKYILQWFSGLDAVGIYTIGNNFGFMLSLLVTGFTNAWYPYFMSFIDKQSEARVLFGRILTYYVIGFGMLSLLFYLFAKPVVIIMTQPSFFQAYKVVGLSATAQFLMGVFSILLPGVYFAKDVKKVSLIQAIAALLAIGLNLILIPMFDLLGAAIALVLGFLAMVILQQIWNFKQKYLDIKYEWNRISWFALFYISYVVVMIWERNFSLIGEVLFFIIAAGLIPVMSYALLNVAEKRVLWLMAGQLLPGPFKRSSLKI
jgi:O-antigen/teichoic acid export membrane protein